MLLLRPTFWTRRADIIWPDPHDTVPTLLLPVMIAKPRGNTSSNARSQICPLWLYCLTLPRTLVDVSFAFPHCGNAWSLSPWMRQLVIRLNALSRSSRLSGYCLYSTGISSTLSSKSQMCKFSAPLLAAWRLCRFEGNQVYFEYLIISSLELSTCTLLNSHFVSFSGSCNCELWLRLAFIMSIFPLYSTK